jgi:acetolactate synthase-1/2/3 large subunit
MDSIPMVIVTGQVPTPAIGLDAFQECDTVGITRPIVKHNFLVKDVRDLALTMKKAFHIARTGRPGPVVVDVPKDVSMTRAPFHYPASVEMRSYNPVKKGHGGQIRKAAQLLWRPSARTSTPAAASSSATPRPSCARSSTCSASRAPTR